MKTPLLSLMLHLAIALPAMAQLVVDDSYITDQLGQTRSYTEFNAASPAGLDALVAASGENQTWDITSATFEEGLSFTSTLLEMPADVPGAEIPEFFAATYVRIVSTDSLEGYFFENLMGGVMSVAGQVLVGDGDQDNDTTLVQFSPATVDAVFPVTYEATWRDSTSTIVNGLPEATYLITETVVDGWGTLISPEGSESALRIKDVSQSFVIGSSTPLSTEVSYDFVTESGITAYIELDESGAAAEAGYTLPGESTSTSSETIGLGIPESFVLTQNYPNPFNPSTRISYTLPEAGHVKLAVYSLTGEEVAVLADGVQPVGSYSISFEAGHLASGMYLYRLKTDRFTETRLMSLVK